MKLPRAHPLPHLRLWRWGLLALAAAATLVVLEAELLAWFYQAKAAVERSGTVRDTLQLYTGALLLAQGQGERLYDLSLQRQTELALIPLEVAEELELTKGHTLPFLSLPFVAVLFLPLTALPLSWAYVVWSGLNWLLLVTFVAIWAWKARGWTWPERLLWGLGAVSFGPAYRNQWEGQVSLLLVLLLGLGWWALSSRREGWAGLALSLLLIKPQYALLWPLLFLWKRRWRALGGFTLGSGLLLGLSLVVAGAEGMVAYLRLLPRIAVLGGDYGIFPNSMFTWSGLVSLLTGRGWVLSAGPGPLALWLGLCGATLLLLGLAWHGPWRPTDEWQGGRYAATILVSILLSPHTYYQDLALLLIVGFLSWDVLRCQQGLQVSLPAWITLFGGSYVLLIALYIPYISLAPVVVIVPIMALAFGMLVLEITRSHNCRRELTL